MRVIIAGGGTAGHINPGIAIAKEILKNHKDAKITFVGTNNGLEKDLVPKEGFELRVINVRGFNRKLSFDTVLAVKDLFRGMLQSRKLLKLLKPDLVIGTGGYVCGPVLMNASLLKIPTIIHEQNAFPGVTNKILSRFVDNVLISYEESRKYFNGSKVILTGNPVRSEIINANREECRRKLEINNQEKLILCCGGSNGAKRLNQAMEQYIKGGIGENIKLLFATGSKNYDSVINELKRVDLNNVQISAYIYNMHEVMPAADLIICRAGAITLSEVTALGVPSIVIPSPNVANNHQEYNARALEKVGAAEMILEKDLGNIDFKKTVEDILNNNDKLESMKGNSKNVGILDANEKIYRVVKKYLK